MDLLIDPENHPVGQPTRSIETVLAAINNPDHAATTFAIVLRQGILAADADPAANLDEIAAQALIENAATWCARNDVPHIVVDSGRPGHGHVYAVVGDDQDLTVEFTALARRLWPHSQIRTGGSRIRPPFAPHRQPDLPGARIVGNLSAADAIAVLGLEAHKPPRTAAAKKTIDHVTVQPGQHPTLTDDWWQLARYGRGPLVAYKRDKPSEPDWSWNLAILAARCIQQRWTLQQWLNLALDPRNAGCIKPWRRNPLSQPERVAYCTRVWNNEVKRREEGKGVRHQPRAELLAVLRSRLDEAHAATWHPKARPTILAVAEAHAIAAMRAGTTVGYGLSERHACELAGITSRRIYRERLNDLKRAGLITVVQHWLEDGVEANRFAFVARSTSGSLSAQDDHQATDEPHSTLDSTSGSLSKQIEHKTDSTSGSLSKQSHDECSSDARKVTHLSSPTAGGCGKTGALSKQSAPDTSRPLGGWMPDEQVGHDLWTSEGLGKSAWLIYRHLTLDEPLTLDHLAARVCGVDAPGRTSVARIRKELLVLHEHGLARKVAKVAWTKGAASLDRAARALGVVGTVAALSDQHAKERENFARVREISAAADPLDLPPADLDSMPTVEEEAWLWQEIASGRSGIMAVAPGQGRADGDAPGWTRAHAEQVCTSMSADGRDVGVRKASDGSYEVVEYIPDTRTGEFEEVVVSGVAAGLPLHGRGRDAARTAGSAATVA